MIRRKGSAHVQPEDGDLNPDEGHGDARGQHQEQQTDVGPEAHPKQAKLEPAELHGPALQQVLQRVDV
ncbi:hypothetical protein D3C73_1313670 [compost metagenome]